MKKIIILMLFLMALLNAREFTLASYNVENLFDLKNNKTEYKQYQKKYSNWNSYYFKIKLQNTIKTIKDIDADIIALQEIENKNLLELIKKELPQYKYISFNKYKKASVGLGFLSKIKILKERAIKVKFKKRLYRPILETTFKFDKIEFKVFNNHWPSKRVSESFRIKYAQKLFLEISKLPKDYDYILLGDFNSNYNEDESLLFNDKLNDSYGITGINQVLNTKINKLFVDKSFKYKQKVHYNPYLELSVKNRFSNKFRSYNTTPDNILLPKALFDKKKLSYINNSFKIFKPSYLYKNKRINRWKIKNKKYHQGEGYSDHLPIFAKFSTKKQKKILEKKILTINDLYKNTTLKKAIKINSIYVIYKNKNSCIIKQKNKRAIYIYNFCKNLKLSYVYDIKVKKIKSFNGLKEITELKILREKFFSKNYQTLYKDANKIDLFNENNTNEIIFNLKAIYKKGYLFFKNKKIKLYAKDKSILPKNNQKITIISAHLASYKGKAQIIIYKKSDYKEN